jgi:hypothetical protein
MLKNAATSNNGTSAGIFMNSHNNVVIEHCRVIGGFQNGIDVIQNQTLGNKNYYIQIRATTTCAVRSARHPRLGSGIEITGNKDVDIGGQLNQYAIGIRVGGSTAQGAFKTHIVRDNTVLRHQLAVLGGYGIFSDAPSAARSSTTASPATTGAPGKLAVGMYIVGQHNRISDNHVTGVGSPDESAIFTTDGTTSCFDNYPAHQQLDAETATRPTATTEVSAAAHHGAAAIFPMRLRIFVLAAIALIGAPALLSCTEHAAPPAVPAPMAPDAMASKPGPPHPSLSAPETAARAAAPTSRGTHLRRLIATASVQPREMRLRWRADRAPELFGAITCGRVAWSDVPGGATDFKRFAPRPHVRGRPTSTLASCARCQPSTLVIAIRIARLLVIAGLLPLRELDLLRRQVLVRDVVQDVADDVEAPAPLVVGARDVPRRVR